MLAYDAAWIRNLDDDTYHPQRRPRAEGRAARARRPPRPVDGSRASPHPQRSAGRREAARRAEPGRGHSPALPAAGRRRRARAAPARAGSGSAPVRPVIVLDTNILSELMRSEPAAAVFAWVSAQPRATLYTTSVSKAEILYGIAVLPEGRRRLALAAAAEAMFTDDFAGRVLPFDEL